MQKILEKTSISFSGDTCNRYCCIAIWNDCSAGVQENLYLGKKCYEGQAAYEKVCSESMICHKPAVIYSQVFLVIYMVQYR